MKKIARRLELLLCISVAAMFLIPAIGPVAAFREGEDGVVPMGYPPEGIYGYVKNNAGNPLSMVYVGDGGDLHDYTDANGYYYISVDRYACFLMKAHRSGYWEMWRNVTITPTNPLPRADFTLAPDQTSYATLLAMYATVNRAHSGVRLAFENGHESKVTIRAYNAGSGGTFEATSGSMTIGQTTNETSWIRQRAVVVTGFYYNTPGKFNNAHVSQQTMVFENRVNFADYMSHSQVVGWTESVPRNAAYVEKFETDSGSITLQAGLSVSIGVSASFFILGVSVSYTFECTMADTETVSKTMRLGIWNFDSVSHYYEWYLEGNNIYHVWEKTGP